MSAPAAQSRTSQSLLDAIRETYAVEVHTPPFHERLYDLSRALITTSWVAVVFLKKDEIRVLAGQIPEEEIAPVSEAATGLLAQSDVAEIVVVGPSMVARIAIPGGGVVALAVGRVQGGQVAQSLAYERLSLLSSLSFSQNAHPDLSSQSDLLGLVQSAASDPAPETLQALADKLARHMSADYAAVSICTGGSLSEVNISGQGDGAKRASLPDRLRSEMQQTAKQHARSATRMFAGPPGSDDGLVLHVESPQRNTATTILVGAAYALSQTRAAPRRWTRARLMKIGVWALVLIGIALVPLPDRVEIPATVEAVERRVLTAPFTARLDSLEVSDSETVVPGATVLALDTEAIDLDLIEVRAEMARALLDREAARAARRAADLRNAELEVERFEARIARLTRQLEEATLIAPIDGIVIAPDLAEKLGTTVRQGDPLLEIADPRALRLTLAIPDDRLGLVEAGLEGRFRPDYDPRLVYTSAITSVSPAVAVRADAPVLDGRASLQADTDGLRPGLRGVFAPQSEWVPAGLLAYRAIRDWVLLRLWF